MGKVSSLRSYSRSFSTPRRPYEKERFDYELRLCGIYGLRCKKEVYRVHYLLSKVKKNNNTQTFTNTYIVYYCFCFILDQEACTLPSHS